MLLVRLHNDVLSEKLKSSHDWKKEKILLSKPNINVSARSFHEIEVIRTKECGTVPYPRVPCMRSHQGLITGGPSAR